MGAWVGGEREGDGRVRMGKERGREGGEGRGKQVSGWVLVVACALGC